MFRGPFWVTANTAWDFLGFLSFRLQIFEMSYILLSIWSLSRLLFCERLVSDRSSILPLIPSHPGFCPVVFFLVLVVINLGTMFSQGDMFLYSQSSSSSHSFVSVVRVFLLTVFSPQKDSMAVKINLRQCIFSKTVFRRNKFISVGFHNDFRFCLLLYCGRSQHPGEVSP